MLKQLLIILLSLLCAASAQAQKNKLNLFIWSEYIDPQVIQSFEKAYDCKVSIDLYADNESMVAKLQAGGTSRYDVVVPSDSIVPSMITKQLLAPLRHENLPKHVEQHEIAGRNEHRHREHKQRYITVETPVAPVAVHVAF